jgi:imidazole glycerol-phosphate synthase subunit HisH
VSSRGDQRLGRPASARSDWTVTQEAGSPDRTRVAVVDYGAGNLGSIVHALEHVGAAVSVARRPADLDGLAAVVVPGVGASGPAMRSLRRSGLDRGLEHALGAGAWYLGICLGMQLLFDASEEDGAVCLGWIGGRVAPIQGAPRLPHVGWNTVEAVRPHRLLSYRLLPETQRFPGPGSAVAPAFYFVHGYAAVPDDWRTVVAETEHGGRFASVVAHRRLLGVQFHPEKSGPEGIRLLRSFVSLATTGDSVSSSLPPTGVA